jgi:hypothetical protein
MLKDFWVGYDFASDQKVGTVETNSTILWGLLSSDPVGHDSSFLNNTIYSPVDSDFG